MNKIFLNHKVLHLRTIESTANGASAKTILIKDSKDLKKQIELFEQEDHRMEMTLDFKSEKFMKAIFEEVYTTIEAAGGIVRNKEDKVLLIFRLGKWDLPKGKVEKGEEIEAAALREVEEECGITELKSKGKFGETYHTYQLKGKAILKISHWFKMDYLGNSMHLIPQTEEGITDARWMSKMEIQKILPEAYASIEEILKLYFNRSI